jgi:NAD(P)H-hydrate epimerase
MKRIVEAELGRGSTIVMDGGALKAAAKAELSRDVILTPHSGEFASLGYRVTDDIDERVEKAVEFSERHRCTLVLKGHETVITDGASVKVNRASTAALATMGTGDVLAGMIAAYAAMHGSAFESAVAGVTAHSMLGDLLHRTKGDHVIATDLIEALPLFLKRFDKD